VAEFAFRIICNLNGIYSISLCRYFKNTATFKLYHNALDIALNVIVMKQETIFDKK